MGKNSDMKSLRDVSWHLHNLLTFSLKKLITLKEYTVWYLSKLIILVCQIILKHNAILFTGKINELRCLAMKTNSKQFFKFSKAQ